MKKTMKLVSLILAMLMLVACAAACGGGDKKDEGKVYRTYMSSDAPMLNGHDDPGTQVQTPYNYCNSTLWIAVPDDNGAGYHYVGDLATDLPKKVKTEEMTYVVYESQEDPADSTKKIQVAVEKTGKVETWEFKVREEAKWHNGEVLNADDLIYSWKMALDPVMLNQMANFVADQAITIMNATPYYKGDVKEWDKVGIKKIDDQTIQLQLVGEYEADDLCSHFTDRSCYPVYEEYYNAGMSADKSATTYGETLKNWMGCGAYTFKEWKQDNKHVYVKNPDHWLADLYHYDVVEIYIIKEHNAAVQMFEAGKLDDLTPNSTTIETYLEDPRLVTYSSLGVQHLDINTESTKNPLAPYVEFRKAIYHALDRETLAKQCFGYMKAGGWYVNGQAGLFSDSGVTYRESEWGKKVEGMVAGWSADTDKSKSGYNPTLALDYLKKAYDKAGLSYDKQVEIILLYGDDETSWKAAAEYLQVELPKVFNNMIKLTLQSFPAENMGTTAAKKQYEWDLSTNSWSRSLSRNYPYEAFYYYTSGYGSHPNVYLSDAFDAQFKKCQDLKDQGAAYEKLLEETYNLEKIYLDEVVNIPVVHSVNYTLFSERLQLKVKTYIPGFGWGTIFGDIVEK